MNGDIYSVALFCYLSVWTKTRVVPRLLHSNEAIWKEFSSFPPFPRNGPLFFESNWLLHIGWRLLRSMIDLHNEKAGCSLAMTIRFIVSSPKNGRRTCDTRNDRLLFFPWFSVSHNLIVRNIPSHQWHSTKEACDLQKWLTDKNVL